MNVYLQPPQPSRGLQRIADALQRYAPSTIEVVDDPARAQLTVIYAIGRRDHVERQVHDILEQGGKYAVVQVCLKSTMSPDSRDWMRIWQEAEVVWSYYNLIHRIIEDEYHAGTEDSDGNVPRYFSRTVNFIHAPLGVDSTIFYPRNVPKAYTIATSGGNKLQESIRECALAAREVNGHVYHLGNPRRWYDNMTYSNNVDDHRLATAYSACEFVSGLRRTEGFELPAAEGLLCGAVPILFDSPDYRFNYKHWGRYIKEGTRAEVVEQLVELFKQGAEPLSPAELSEARHWFNWERVCGEFWNRCLQ